MRLVMNVIMLLLLASCSFQTHPSLELLEHPNKLNHDSWNRLVFSFDASKVTPSEQYKVYADISITGSPKIRVISTPKNMEYTIFKPGDIIYAIDRNDMSHHRITAKDHLISFVLTNSRHVDENIVFDIKPINRRVHNIKYRATYVDESKNSDNIIMNPSEGPEDQQNHPCILVPLKVL